ncbi:MAG: hypothetical protein AAFX85_01295 [Pseudomonadota bacterium]
MSVAAAEGIQFPADESRRRSTTAVSQAVVAEALATLDPAAADRARTESDWRRGYRTHFAATVTGAVAAGGSAASTLAKAGLDALHERFVFVRGDQVCSAPVALTQADDTHRLHTGTVRGTQGRVATLRVPYGGQVLEGDALRRQIDRWVEGAIMEPSAAQALHRVLDRPEWLDLRDQQFVLLGAAAELAPLQTLAHLGANLVAVDLDRPHVWRRLLATVRDSAGRLTFPLRRQLREGSTDEEIVEAAGADLLSMTPEITDWLRELPGPFCVGAYGYLHGRDHVRLEVAMDALMDALSQHRPDHSLAFLLTPSDVYAVPTEVAQVARSCYAREGARRPWRAGLRTLTGGRLYAPNVAQDLPSADGTACALYDGIVPAQGPNYALAKHIQRWRALAALAKGVRVSVNVAPSTTTASVVSRREFAAAFAGASHYGVEVFAPATSNALMAALLVHDLRAERPPPPADHTAFADQAVHGGMWRMAVQLRSVIEIAALRGMLNRPTQAT